MNPNPNNEQAKQSQKSLSGSVAGQSTETVVSAAFAEFSIREDGGNGVPICSKSQSTTNPRSSGSDVTSAHTKENQMQTTNNIPTVKSNNGHNNRNITPAKTIPQAEPEEAPTTPVTPEIIDIPEGEEWLVGGVSKPSPRLNGIFPATVVGLRQKITTGGKGRCARFIIDLEVNAPSEDATPVRCEYSCTAKWTPNGPLQDVAMTILGRELEAQEVRGNFNINVLRGQRCQAYITEHRSRSKNGEQSARSFVVGQIYSINSPVDAQQPEEALATA